MRAVASLRLLGGLVAEMRLTVVLATITAALNGGIADSQWQPLWWASNALLRLAAPDDKVENIQSRSLLCVCGGGAIESDTASHRIQRGSDTASFWVGLGGLCVT